MPCKILLEEVSGEFFSYREIKLFSWSIVIIIAFIAALLVLYRGLTKRKEFLMRKQFFTSGAALLFGFALIRLLFLLSDLENWTNGKTLFHYQLVYLGYNLLYIGFFFMVNFFDTFIINSPKKILKLSFLSLSSVYFGLFLFLPLLLSYEEYTRYILYSGLYYVAFITFIIFISILKRIKLKGLLRFLWAFLGFILVLIASPLESLFPLPIVPLTILIGYILILTNIELTIIIFSEYFSAKQLCLIHRGAIEGKIAFCPKCFVKYCERCFSAVILVEGNCWACGFDILNQRLSQKPRTFLEHNSSSIEGKSYPKKNQMKKQS
ncbi:MAG: membrane protein of unknown function [Promethearchaeota archaeon]|nr:MAG: membrane protein of unknown function [Candidatus Lokiarchaeota archaeon]